MGHEKVLVAVAVEVGCIDAHARLGAPHVVESDAGQQRLVVEPASSVVDPKLVRVAVVGHVEVGPAVGVEIGGNDSQSGPECRVKPGRFGHVFEAAPALVAKQAVGNGVVGAGPTIVARATLGIAFTLEVGRKVSIMGDEQVQPPVTVVVKEGGARAPARIIGSRELGYVAERAIAVVAKHLVGADVRDIEVDPSVVVEVGGRDAHAVAARVDARLPGHVGESRRRLAARPGEPGRGEIVAVEAVLGRTFSLPREAGRVRARRQLGALNKIKVEVAIVVIVK